MTMKWRPNDLRVANILRRNFSEKEIDENFRADIDRREFPQTTQNLAGKSTLIDDLRSQLFRLFSLRGLPARFWVV